MAEHDGVFHRLLFRRLFAREALDDQHVLAARLLLLIVRAELLQRAAAELLIALRELAAGTAPAA